ncbi:arginase family protein [Anoxynatronum buryatiense]|uniref:Arginase family enzyme n=1 Tax=Anoxynatronum buryatiense TaxID=489973 RepID=A0AA46AJW7_9CLOT|nr:arginase family protein [Anoxynatronum buryatiense]SMP64166.1 Arginase family enzyme [Anoxynatronum buryatiense]
MKQLKVAGIPMNSGGFYTGTETTPKVLREAGLIDALEKQGISVLDMGDVNIPSYIPRHNVPPIRNWPGPRVVWEEICHQSKDWFHEDEVLLLFGGDCSIETGTVHSLYRRYAADIHLIVIDAHIDAYKPSADHCMGAAGMGLWFLLEENDFLNSLKGFSGDNVSIVGYQHESEINTDVKKHPLSELREKGIRQIIQKVLQEIPQNRKIMVHLDLDVIAKAEMHAVYSPSEAGLSMTETTSLLREILADSRTAGVEITEFFPPYDPDGSQSKALINMLVDVFRE